MTFPNRSRRQFPHSWPAPAIPCRQCECRTWKSSGAAAPRCERRRRPAKILARRAWGQRSAVSPPAVAVGGIVSHIVWTDVHRARRYGNGQNLLLCRGVNLFRDGPADDLRRGRCASTAGQFQNADPGADGLQRANSNAHGFDEISSTQSRLAALLSHKNSFNAEDDLQWFHRLKERGASGG